MLKELETRRKGQSKSPALSNSPHFLNINNTRRSTSPTRYATSDITDFKKLKTPIPFSINSTKMSRLVSKSDKSTEIIQKLSLTGCNDNYKKPPTPRISENPLRKISPRVIKPNINGKDLNIDRNKCCAQSKSALSQFGQNFKFTSLALKKLEGQISDENSFNDHKNSDFKGKTDEKKNYGKNSSFKSSSRVPLAPFCKLSKVQSNGNRSVSVEKRKLPARYLKIEVQSSRKSENLQPHFGNDLKILQDNNSENSLRDFEAAKLGRMHMKALRKGSILKNVYEEESWHWSSPEISPAKARRVHFPND